MEQSEQKREIWFVYDGECPLCKSAALAFRIKKEYGQLNLLSARENEERWLIQEITSRGYDLDEGMVIYDNERFYHGKDALRFMARFGDGQGGFNLFNKWLFWSDTFAKLLYPIMRAGRNLLLKARRIEPINNLNND